MSITDELREWAKTLTHWWYDPVKDEYTYTTGIMPPSIDAIRLDSNITAIADRIDAEHEAMLVDARKTVYQGYIELPKDADNVPWHVGDRDEDGNVVTQLRLSSDGWYAITDGPSAFHPEQRRHHHAPTVEDVLREFTDAILEWSGKSGTVAEVGTWSDVAAEYAAKLQLKEDK